MNALTPQADTLVQHYAEVRARLWGKPAPSPSRAVLPPPPPEPVELESPALPRQSLGDLALVGVPGWQQLTLLAAMRWGVTRAEMMGDARDLPVAVARQHAWWLIATHTGANAGRIGQLFGRNHSTILNGIARHELRRAGRAPLPYAWTSDRIAEFRRLVIDEGLSQAAAGAAMGVPPREVKRLPGRAEIHRDILRDRRQRQFAKVEGAAP